ncbi:hypothetical protein EST38_g6294 [Candolleomyces aberdarensis]|uniref:RNA helicase n=1 Tax=Candolleomyces aberdarensis TaxID=2316362 RepID=A0A4Q2DK48_9AGAR|nr:hypothetical protein EST38_g6294 [Candolleomyces aberdarensis]
MAATSKLSSLPPLCTRCRVTIFGSRVWPNVEARHFSTSPPQNRDTTEGIWQDDIRLRQPRRKKDGDDPKVGFTDRPPRPTSQRTGWQQEKRAMQAATYRGAQLPKALVKLHPFIAPPNIKPGEAIPFFESHVQAWTKDPKMRERLVSFGIHEDDVPKLMKAFRKAVEAKELTKTEEQAKLYGIDKFNEPMHQRINVSILYSNIFFTWCTNPSNRALLLSSQHSVRPETLDHMLKLVEATDRRYLAEESQFARKMCRKVIMHVGPTNSGKTYHALRALAGAESGVYAGPLRLLAHEIWERLNLGQIAPSNADDPDFKGTEVTERLEDLPHKDSIKKHGNPKWARLCNMVTGEEQKMVAETSRMLSCTVEMLPYSIVYDVGIVDEIQMISDPQRGSAWTNAVLGLPAKELHLCGEETAVPIVQELLKHTGDELVIRRYERLTPLKVEKESLKADWTKIQKGDCVVAFSRSGIFAIKRKIEQSTGLRCAIIYGRLPPEIRSEQAALFNDPNSGYDVLVGSDAIGMGLNLKIRRIIFEALTKSTQNGGVEKLSISSVKQIAGRAGRFGMHGDNEPGGYVTTFEDKDMAYLKEALNAPFTSLPFARITFDVDTMNRLVPVLPPQSSTSTFVQAHHFISPLPPKIRYHESDMTHLPLYDFIDGIAGEVLSNGEKLTHAYAPIPWRDATVVQVLKNFLTQMRDNSYVDLMQGLKSSTNFMESLEMVEKAKKNDHPARTIVHLLNGLESFHKVLVLYIWLSFRSQIVYPQYNLAAELKERLEDVLQWSLEGLSAQMHSQDRAKRSRAEQKEWKGRRGGGG